MAQSDVKYSEKILKALANRRRIAIILFLARTREAPVAEIAEHINLSFKATSKHLNILKSADILESHQVSLSVFYRLGAHMPPIAKAALKPISNSRE